MLFFFVGQAALGAPAHEVWVAADRPVAAWVGVPGIAVGERRRVGISGAEQQLFASDDGLRALNAAGAVVVERRVPTARLPAGIRSFAEGDAVLIGLAGRATRGGLAQWGQSVTGRAIEGLWVGQAPATGAPVYRVIGAHHGDEPSSAEVALAVAEALVDGDGEDAAITAILDRVTVWVVPYLNPDGFEAGTRENDNDVDLNRNYDFEWASTVLHPGVRPFSEPETAAVRAQAATARPTLGLSLHSGAVNIGWPWNHAVDNPPEAPTLGGIAQLYGELCTAPGFWLTQGADWYVTNGDLNDWAYGRHGTFDYTVEVALVDTEEAVGWHINAVLAVLAERPAVDGTVTDAVSGAPVEAQLWVDGGMPFTSDAATGRFATMEPGASLRVEAPGYATAEVELSGGSEAVALVPDTLAAGRLPDPVLFEPAEVGTFTLVRPGAASVTVDGEVDPQDLDPGWYSVEWPDGAVWPRALLVEHPTDAVLGSWSSHRGRLEVAGEGFAEGARAWILAGAERVPVEVDVTVEGPTLLTLDLGGIDTTPPADAVIWVNGAVLAIADVSVDGARTAPPSACGCTSGGTSAAGVWSMVGAFAVRRRRIRS